jgi:beta-galactosidase/beta-glucuronidase
VVLQANADPCTQLATEPLPFPGPGSAMAVASALGDAVPAVRAEVRGANYDYHYLVDGQPTVIRGMGYNPQYAGRGTDERSALHRRDFAAMAASGVNTVWGWNPVEFDGLTLDMAHEYGLGVALPYDFDWRLDFTDPSVRTAVRTDVLDWVARYRAHPALRMWAIGNETFHKLVPPAWCIVPPTAEQVTRAQALAGFYVELIDAVHALDPNHPIIYRASEDSYISWLAEALRAGGPRPWFVYGVNVYTPRLAEVLREWPNQGLDTALLVSEFGPGPEARPAGYREYWQVIRSHARSVIGGVVYVWFAEGPEEIDRVYGLVNPDGWAVDGALEVIRQVFSGDASDVGMR